MWTVIGGRRVPVLVFVLGGMFGGLLVALAIGIDPRAVAFVVGFSVLVIGLNALSSRLGRKPPRG